MQVLNTSVPFKRVTEAALAAFPLLPPATFQEAIMQSPSESGGAAIPPCHTTTHTSAGRSLGQQSRPDECVPIHGVTFGKPLRNWRVMMPGHADESCTFGDTRAFYNKKFLPAMEVRLQTAVWHASRLYNRVA